MSFRRTATGLIIIVAVTAIAIGVYLYYNFNSRSSLILVVPKNCNWMYHIQSSKIRKEATGQAPLYLDSVSKVIQQLPIFKGIEDPAAPGIKLFSDIILFGNKYGAFAALSLNSEERFHQFIQKIPAQLKGGNPVTTPHFTFVKMKNRPVYFAYKHKAVLMFMPKDTSDNLQNIEAAYNEIFAATQDYSIAGMDQLKPLYEAECDIIFYQQNHQIPSHGVILRNKQAKFLSAKTGKELQAATAVKIFDIAKPEGMPEVKKNKTMSSEAYLNHTLKTLYYYLKPFTHD